MGVKASGTGSLKFTIRSDNPNELGDSRGSGAGTFATNWSDDASNLYGEGETFYVQYRWRADCDFVYFDCNPASPTYKTSRRFYRITGGGVSTFAKLSIIGTGDIEPAPLFAAYSCTQLEIVVTHGPDHFPVGYHNCGWYEGFSQNFFSTNFDFQPNGSPYGELGVNPPNCWYRLPSGQVRAWGDTGPECFYLESDQWMTLQVKVSIGTWQTDKIGDPNSHITIWAAREGEAQQVITDNDFYAHDPQEFGRNDWSIDGKYGKIWLFPFMTDKDPNEDHPDAHVWYDELIVSTAFVADPR